MCETVLSSSPLISDIAPEDREKMFSCLGAFRRRYPKDAVLFSPGVRVGEVGLVLSGRVQISREDAWGGRTLVAVLAPGELFLETFACAGEPLSVTVSAPAEAEVLYLRLSKLLSPCAAACPFHARLMQNLLVIFSRKNLFLSSRMELLSRRSTREKLLCFLSQEARRLGTRRLILPHTRQELADILCVDRSAMTVELSRLQKDGLLRFSGREFTLLSPDDA